jgi:EmrB/QacA subfamily drug resistance transporter
MQAATDSSPQRQNTPSTMASSSSSTGPDEAKEASTAEATAETEYPPQRTVIVVLAAVFMAQFLVALDRLIIATAIPVITDQFNSLNDVGWYASAYLLPMAAFQLFTGKIYTFYNPKWVYMGCITLFETGSLICGVAPNSVTLIIGRAVAGLGTCGMMSGTIIIVVHVVPLHKRPAYMGIMGMIFGVASVVGPLLGGVFTDEVSWRWCFYINLPIGGVVLAVIFFVLKLDFEARQKLSLKEKIIRLDPLGTLLFVPSIVCLLLALQNGGTEWAWSSWRVILLLVLFAVTLVAFGIVQLWRKETATVPPRFLKYRSINAAVCYSFFNGASMQSMIYFIPIWFQAIKGTSAVESGIRTIPLVLGLVVTSIMAGVLTRKVGYYTPWMYISAVLTPVGAGLISTWSPSTGHSAWIGYQALYGLGLGMGMQQPSVAAQTTLNKKDVPIGASLVFFSQTLGGAIFASVANNLFLNELAKGIMDADIKGLSASIVTSVGATDLRKFVPADALPQVLQIYNLALRHAFYVGVGTSSVLVVGAAFMEWKSVKQQTPAAQKPAKEQEHSSEGSKLDVEKQ